MISSRTPEGDPNRCPICGKAVRLEPSTVPIRDAPCPHCGQLLLWSRLKEDQRTAINRLAQEIADMSQSKLSPAEYYPEFRRRLTTALAAPAAAVWLRTPHDNLCLQAHMNITKIGLDRNPTGRQTHEELLRQACTRGQPGLIYPQSSVDGEQGAGVAGNPTDYVVLIAPILVLKRVVGLVEVWQDPLCGPDAQRGFLQYLMRMTALASRYVKNATTG